MYEDELSIAARRMDIAGLEVKALFLVERMTMLQELTRLAIDNLPNNTDSDVTEALLNGIGAILSADTSDAYVMSLALSRLAAGKVSEAQTATG